MDRRPARPAAASAGLPVRQRLAEVAAVAPDRRALVGFDANANEQRLSWAELAGAVERLAGTLAAEATGHPGPVVVAVEAANSVPAVVEIMAVLAAELPLLPVNPAAKPPERVRLFDFLGSQLGRVLAVADGHLRPHGDPVPGAAGRSGPPVAYLLPTGGSSGVPKVSVRPGPLRFDPRTVPSALQRQAGWRSGQRQLILGPLSHAAPFTSLLDSLLDGNTVVLPPVFLPAWAVRLVADHAVEWIQLTPAHMRSIVLLADPDPAALASVRTVLHTAAPCDSLTKRRWIDLVGPQRLYETYASTEGIGATLVRGDEWLRHPGTVGRGFVTQIRILDEQGRRLPAGAVGKVFLRAARSPGGRAYLGDAVLETTVDGFASVGDYGWLNEDGYLFLAPRRHDVINVGGEKVYPNEVEAELLEHPAVVDAVVVAVPDDSLGATVGAYVVRAPGPAVTGGELMAHCRRRLTTYKAPTRVTFVDEVPRTPAGKVQRWRLTEPPG